MSGWRGVSTALAAGTLLLVTGCTGASTPGAETSLSGPTASRSATAQAEAPPAATPSAPASTSEAPATPTPDVDPRTEPAALSIPDIGLRDLAIVPYEGTTDDWPGTRIQNEGDGASPYGDQGGVGPGETGNYLVTAHRLSAGGPLRDLPDLTNGDTVTVVLGDVRYTYRITATRETSFRSEQSLAEQRAAVPGDPGATPTKAMITLSTCATPEDNAAGNFWRDDRGNPEHRIDKIGTLVSAERV
ncbi:class E sortase [Streptomyces sp. NPDC088387]|uniref:class E sortase n=1 Tax=Streptomyces sp. NPDC088387 TaxID=3365859 RepID=UPI003827BDE1